MTKYELLYIVPAQYTEDELAPIKQKTRETIENIGGKILLEDNLGKKKFVYPIKKTHQGYYLLNHFELDKKNLEKLEKNLRLSDQILRHIVIRYEPKSEMKLERIKEGLKTFAETPIIKTPEKPADRILEKKPEEKEEKTKLEDLDKKLDEILKTDNLL